MTKNSVRSKKSVVPAVVYVAPCNRLRTNTAAAWADLFRHRFEYKVNNTLETATVRINDFKTKLDRDAFSAFDWDGKGAVEAAGRQRAATEVQQLLVAMDTKNDGYAGGDNLVTLRRVNEWIVNNIVEKVRYNSQLDPRENARLMGLSELQSELKYGFTYFPFDVGLERASTCVAQEYEG